MSNILLWVSQISYLLNSVNNAGIMKSKTLDQIDDAFFDDHFNLNVKSPLFLTKAAVQHMAPGMQA